MTTDTAADKPDCMKTWLETDSGKLKVGTSSRLGVQFLAPREDAKEGELDLLLVVSIPEARFAQQREVKLLQGIDSEPTYFDVTAVRPGEYNVRVSFYLARELLLLEERVYTIFAQED